MQEGDVQIKGYPVRLPLESPGLQRQSRGLHRPRQNHHAAERPHRLGDSYPLPGTVDEGVAITAQEAWTERNSHQLQIPEFVSHVIEQIAFVARDDKRIDKRSGVSQRLPISAMENVISNAERRAIRAGEKLVVPRIGDIYAAMPAMTGKLELEYEGELKGADNVVREIIRPP